MSEEKENNEENETVEMEESPSTVKSIKDPVVRFDKFDISKLIVRNGEKNIAVKYLYDDGVEDRLRLQSPLLFSKYGISSYKGSADSVTLNFESLNSIAFDEDEEGFRTFKNEDTEEKEGDAEGVEIEVGTEDSIQKTNEVNFFQTLENIDKTLIDFIYRNQQTFRSSIKGGKKKDVTLKDVAESYFKKVDTKNNKLSARFKIASNRDNTVKTKFYDMKGEVSAIEMSTRNQFQFVAIIEYSVMFKGHGIGFMSNLRSLVLYKEIKLDHEVDFDLDGIIPKRELEEFTTEKRSFSTLATLEGMVFEMEKTKRSKREGVEINIEENMGQSGVVTNFVM